MMTAIKTILFGHENKEIRKIIREHGFVLVKSDPDFVISYGGDGTFMQAEYTFPGIPKILLKRSHICKLCQKFDNEEILKRVVAGEYSKENLMKLDARVNQKTLTATNDVTIHNRDPRHAIRYRLKVNNVPMGAEIIGDGVVVSTPVGSTGYYRSITDSYFELGMGLAFNNSTEQSDHVVLKEDSTIKMKIVRGSGTVFADNQDETIEVSAHDQIIIKKSPKRGTLIRV